MSKHGGLSKILFFVALPVVVVLLLLIFASLELYRHFTTSERYLVKSVEVVTDGPAKKKDLIGLVAIRPNTNIFALDLTQLRSRVEKNPWVESAAISRALPDRLLIQYKAHEPVAILSYNGMYYLNKYGRPFYRVGQGDSLQYPLFILESHSGSVDLQMQDRLRHAWEIYSQLNRELDLNKYSLGDIAVHGNQYRGGAPFMLTLQNALPASGKSTHFSVALAEENIDEQLGRLAVVMQQLHWQKRSPKLVRLELGKKVVVKISQ